MFGSSSWKTQLLFAHPASESDMKSRSRKLATGDMAVTSCHVEEIRKSHGPPPCNMAGGRGSSSAGTGGSVAEIPAWRADSLATGAQYT